MCTLKMYINVNSFSVPMFWQAEEHIFQKETQIILYFFFFKFQIIIDLLDYIFLECLKKALHS